jgi:hypothetical protein
MLSSLALFLTKSTLKILTTSSVCVLKSNLYIHLNAVFWTVCSV